MKKYDSYKDSGISWLGEIPFNWTKLSVRRITEDHKQGYYSSNGYIDDGYKLVRITDLDANGNIDVSSSPSVSPTDKELTIFQIKQGDILFPRTGSIGLVGVAKEDMKAVFASYLIRFRFIKSTDNSFMRYFFTSEAFLNGLFSDLHGGVNQNIHAENIKDQYLALPTLEEQAQISKYLDQKTTQIDTLISKKEKLIELLKEERTAIINNAVTKGLAPNVPMKDSGIEWLGEIPEGWEVKRLKYILETTKGYAFKSDLFKEKGVPVVKASDIKNKSVRTETTHFIEEKVASKYESVTLKHGDILISTVGSTPDVTNSAVGQIGRVPKALNHSVLNQNTVRLEIYDDTLMQQSFLFYLIQNNNYRKYLDLYAHGTANQASLKLVDILGYQAALPPIQEQLELVKYIQVEQSKVDELLKKVKIEIELLKEYKTALISEVITGKVDVRDDVKI